MQIRLGVFETGKGKNKAIQVNYASDSKDCGIIFFDRLSGEEIYKYAFVDEPVIGNIHQLTLPYISSEQFSYLFYEEGKPVIDKKSLAFCGNDEFGVPKNINMYRGIIPDMTYNWEGDKLLKLPCGKNIAYCLHVRGFTVHESSNVTARGTFAGVIEKIPYLKELGITTLELQPAYEFPEYPISHASDGKISLSNNMKVNYWGYTEGFYYTPKRAYTYGENPVVEFKDMVKVLHQNGIELIMQFYFPDNFPVTDIAPILRHWHYEYHVDGFHLKGNELPATSLAADCYLYNAKIWYGEFHAEKLDVISKNRKQNMAEYNDQYMYSLRSFLKSDWNTLVPAVKMMYENGKSSEASVAEIKYLSNYYGFTLWDMVSYQEKHNEANGEENRDGRDCNLTWNCGVEGVCHKIEVQVLRERQLRNALALLFTSQGIPLIFMGDEFCNSQMGNNNPYCQDNEITWLDWSKLKSHEGLHAYVRQLIWLRKNNDLFNVPNQKITNCSNGVPYISYHGIEAWKFSPDESILHIGVLLNGTDSGCYIAINMHWEKQYLALPHINKNCNWELVFSTEGSQKRLENNHQILLEPRSVSVFLIKK